MQVLKALSDETRFEIVKYLLNKDKEVCICELDALFNKDLSVIYRHVKKLEDAGITESRKEGRKLFSTIKNKEAIKKLVKAAEVVTYEGSNSRKKRMPKMR